MEKASLERNSIKRIVHIPVNGISLEGALVIPAEAKGIVLFAHGSGSSRHSPRSRRRNRRRGATPCRRSSRRRSPSTASTTP